jgi:hypothetical protein
MMHVRQYRPAFFEGFQNEEHDIRSVNEFASLPFIKRLLDSGTVRNWRARVYTSEHVVVSGIGQDGRSFVVCFVTGPGREELLDLEVGSED